MEQTHDSPTALELYKGHPVQEAAQIILGSLLFSEIGRASCRERV